MKYLIFAFICLTLPGAALAQENMTFGHEASPRATQHIKVPRNARLIVTNNCSPPLVFIGKPASTLANKKFNKPVRILKPGDVMTMDHNPVRLNFMLDTQGIIRNITCG